MPYIERLGIFNHHRTPDFEVGIDGPDEPFSHLIITGPNGSGKSALVRRIAEEVERYQKYTNYGRFVEVSREDGLIPGILQHGRVVSSPTRTGFGPERRESVSISQFFTELRWTTAVHGNFFEPADFIAVFLPDDRRLRVNRVTGPVDLELGPTLARQTISDQFLQYLVNHKLRQTLQRSDENTSTSRLRALTDWFASLERDLADLFGVPGLQLDFRAEHHALRLREPDGTIYGFYRLGASRESALCILAEVMLRLDGARLATDDLESDESQARRSGVVIIDDLDVHLHPVAQQRILPVLTHRYPRLQFIVTTHSPAIICSVDNAVVIDLGKPDRATHSRELQATPYGRLWTEHFGLDRDLDLTASAKLHRLKTLLDKQLLSDAEEDELATLTDELRGTSTSLALEAWSRALKRGRASSHPATGDDLD